MGDPDECWDWKGNINKRTKQPQFAWRRHGISSSTQHHPQRVAMWFTWGDLGFSGVKTTCGNKQLLLDPSTHFDQRFEAVMVDMLHGRHASQIDSSSTGLNQNPEDHETDDDNPTNDY